MRWHAGSWSPPYQSRATHHGDLEVGMVVGYDYRAWEVTHAAEAPEPDKQGRTKRATLRRLHGPKHEGENEWQDIVVRYAGNAYGLHVYRAGRVWLCSCCGHPVPCRQEVAEEVSADSAREFEKRLKRMGPGLCYGCGEVITSRQERMTYPGEHADFPGRSGPTFHLRQKCYGERRAYAQRAKLHLDGGPLVPFCEGTFIRHGDGTFECNAVPECGGVRAGHRCYSICDCCDIRSCTPDGSEVRRARD